MNLKSLLYHFTNRYRMWSLLNYPSPCKPFLFLFSMNCHQSLLPFITTSLTSTTYYLLLGVRYNCLVTTFVSSFFLSYTPSIKMEFRNICIFVNLSRDLIFVTPVSVYRKFWVLPSEMILSSKLRWEYRDKETYHCGRVLVETNVTYTTNIHRVIHSVR